MKTKVCTKCKKRKNVDCFSINNKSNDKLDWRCKKCISYYTNMKYKNDKQHRDKILKRNKRYDKSERGKKILKKYYQTEKYKESRKRVIFKYNHSKKRKEVAKKYLSNPRNKLIANMRSCISTRLKRRVGGRKTKSTFDSLSYTIEELMLHLEKQFKVGMSWDNYGQGGWVLDHIKPDCLFNYKTNEDKEFQECWVLNNLQPLWEKENLIKGSKY